MKKLHILLLLAAFAFLLAAGCTGGLAGPATVAQAAAPSPTPVISALETPETLQGDLLAPGILPPQVLRHMPGSGEGAPVDTTIELFFDQEMDQLATTPALSVTTQDGVVVSGRFDWPDPSHLRFAPSQPLQPATTYQVTLSEKAASANKVATGSPYSFQFQTITPLKISQVFPADGTTQVEAASRITVIFNRPVVALGVSEDQRKLVQPLVIDPPVAGQGEWLNTSTYVYTAEPSLQTNTRYSVTVKAGLQDATGSAASALDKNFVWSFTTLPPSVQGFQVGSMGVDANDPYAPKDIPLLPNITITFRQPMNQEATLSAIALAEQSGGKVPVKATWNAAGDVVTITPTRMLLPGKGHTITIDKTAQSADGGKLGKTVQISFTSVNLPAVTSTVPSEGQTLFNGQFEIHFASPMNLKSVQERVVFDPPLKVENNSWYNEGEHIVYYYGLAPSTKYTVELKPGMLDLYGNAISKDLKVHFTTGPLSPFLNLELPYESVLRRNAEQQFYIRYANIKNGYFKLYQLSLEQFIALRENPQEINTAMREQDLVWQYNEQSDAKVDQIALKPIKLVGKDGKPLPAGFYYLTGDTPEISHPGGKFLDGRFLVIASANLTFKSSLNDALLWVTGFEDGKPIPNVPLKIYDRNYTKLADGKTDANGLLHVDLPADNDTYASRYAVSEGGDVLAFANNNWGSGAAPEQFGIYEQYYGPMNTATAYVYTERPIYRPGQPVYFKGIVRLDNDLSYSLPKDKQVQITISSFDKKVFNQMLDLSSFGTFNGEFKLDNDAALGSYTLNVLMADGQTVIGGINFTVAEYRKPEFLVDVTAQPTNVLGGEKFTATVAANYYAGGGVSGADVTWALRSEPFTFQPPEAFSGYSFSDDNRDSGWFFNLDTTDRTRMVSEGKGTTDENGKLTVTLPADISKENASRRLTLEVTVTDFSGFAVSGRAQVNAHRSLVYPGARSKQYVGIEGQEQSFDLAALAWDGKPVLGQTLTVTISERRWQSVQEQDAQGNLQWKSTVKDIPVKTEDVTVDDQGKASAKFVPPNGGIFRARVVATDKDGNQAAATAYTWVAGKEYIPWQQTNDRTFQLVPNQSSYKPGDTAEILIASPFQGTTYALVTVERGRVRGQEVVQLTSNSTVYKLPITRDMAPVIYVSVMVVKGIDDTSPRPDFKIGFAKLNVSTQEQALNVTVIPDKKQAGPGEQVSYAVQATTKDGKPVKAEISLGLSDLATLSLLDPNSVPILDYFYSPRALSVRTASSIVVSLEDFNEMVRKQAEQAQAPGRGQGSGGGKGEGELGVPEVRQNFPDTAYWKADVVTDENGKAFVTVKLPDNLTTWRMDARAATLDTRVGQVIQDLVSTKPLLVRPQTPRFLIAGDQVTLGTAVHNNTGKDLTVNVKLDAKGVTLSSEAARTVDIKAGEQAYLTWNATVPADSQRADLVFSAKSGEFSDASTPTLGTLDNNGIPVYNYEAPETVGTAGELLVSGTRTEAIRLPDEFQVTQGNLDVKVEPSLAAAMTGGLDYLEHYPYECIEQTVSRFLPNVLTTQALKAAGISNPALEEHLKEQVNLALQRIYNSQNSNGGWGWWKGYDSHNTVTAYVVLGLYEAKQAGYSVDADSLARGISYLQLQLRSLSQDKQYLAQGGRNQQALMLYVLAKAGEYDASRTVQLYDHWQDLNLYARGLLAQTLAIIDPQDARLATLRSDLVNQAILSATGAHWQEKTTDYWNWNTDTRTTAIVLETLVRIDPQNALNPNIVRWLMTSRQGGHWSSTQETAWTLMALTDWMAKSGELNGSYRYAVGLNGKQLAAGSVDGSNLRDLKDITVAVSDLLQGKTNALIIARDGNNGRLYYTAHLTAYLPVPQVKALDNGITISRSYYTLDNAKTPVTSASQGDILQVRLTLVVPNDMHYILVEDPLPAGLEAVDTSLKTSQQELAPPETFNWAKADQTGWGWWYFRHVELRDEKLVLSTDYLPAGTYTYTYLARASTPGTFNVIPPTAQEFYFPEVYGRGDGSQFDVKP